MTEPMTDEEIEDRRQEAERMRGICDDADIYRWLATIDHLKDNRRLWVSEANRYMKERDKLKRKVEELELNDSKRDLELCMKDYHKLKEENVKLIELLDSNDDGIPQMDRP